jgi:protein-tyrosine phosphatase
MSARFDFDWITPDLAVGGRIAMPEVPSLVRDHAVGAVVDLREEDCDEAEVLAAHGVDFLHLPTPDRMAVTREMLADGVRFVAAQATRGRRTLIHCEHGIGRSATLALCVLVARGVAPLEAISRAKDARWRVSPSPEQFEAWTDWMRAHKPGVEPPSFHEFGCIAYRHLSSR